MSLLDKYLASKLYSKVVVRGVGDEVGTEQWLII